MERAAGIRRVLVLAAALLTFVAAPAGAGARASQEARGAVGERLIERSLGEAVAELSERLDADPADENARFALGVARFLRGGETLLRSLHRHGYAPDVAGLAWPLSFRPSALPVHPEPEPVGYGDARAMLARWGEDVAAAERTLAGISGEGVQLRLKVGLVRMDFDDDGAVEPEEALYRAFDDVQSRFTVTEEEAREFEIAFDRGDVDWLRGYCHIALALVDLALAHDWEDVFQRTAHLWFQDPITPYGFLEHPDRGRGWDEETFFDWIALFHGARLEVVDADRCRSALAHLLDAISMSRGMWEHYAREEDDDREWIPNPEQRSVVPGASVSLEQQRAWKRFLDEAEAVLQGRRLIRFWRSDDPEDAAEGTGVDLRRVFTEPRTFDAVHWIQGTAALPYLERGTLAEPGTWERMFEAFDGRVLRHAFWFN